jgi:hypothetical protein
MTFTPSMERKCKYMITFKTPKHHWNYYLALEKDLENLARYIEFCQDNLLVYSIELTHILLSASSEIDVIMKQLCLLAAPTKVVNNINDYRAIVQSQLSFMINEEVSIDRFELSFRPFENWNEARNPDWWKSYNNVKHQRDSYFFEANLQNTINAVGALLLAATHYYKLAFSKEAGHDIGYKNTTRELRPNSSFIQINADYYYRGLIV